MKKLAILLMLPACVSGVQSSDPHPQLALKKQTASMRLRLDPSIEDTFSAKVKSPAGPMPETIDVTGWRDTLTAGFKNGFSPSFTIVDADQPADLTFDLLVADLTFVPAPNQPGQYLARVRTQARVIDKNQNILAHARGRPQSHTVATSPSDTNATAQNAVEAMYEALSGTFFANISVNAQPASQPASMESLPANAPIEAPPPAQNP